jgi:hypothetical protein
MTTTLRVGGYQRSPARGRFHQAAGQPFPGQDRKNDTFSITKRGASAKYPNSSIS